jgi:uncharacterized protein YggE
MRNLKALSILAVLAVPAIAQGAETPTIAVTGLGTVETPPDTATLTFTVRGEGATADAATSAMAALQKAVIQGVRSLDRKLEVQTGSVTIAETRSSGCRGDYDRDRQLSTGACAVTGRVASISTTIVLHSVKVAGTAVGLAGRLGASDATVEHFGLSDDADASRRALASAFAQARARAEAIAAASGAKLGPILSVSDSYNAGIRGSFQVVDAISAEDIGRLPEPVVVDVSPRPVETSMRLTVIFAIEK